MGTRPIPRASAGLPGLAALAALFLAGCASTGPSGVGDATGVRQYLDERTAVTVTATGTPLAFSREQPWLAAHGRDFLDAGLVEFNRAGKRTWYLRVAAWSTIDHREDDRLGQPDLARLWLAVDGEPMDLHAAAWSDGEMGLGDAPFGTPVAASLVAYYGLTRSQAAKVAGAGQLAITTDTGGSRAEFLPAAPGSGTLAGFASYLAGGAVASAAQARTNSAPNER